MLFFMAHDDPHELQNVRFAVVFTRAQIQTTGPASKTDRALIQIIAVWQWSGLLGAFVTVFSDRSATFNLGPSANRRALLLAAFAEDLRRLRLLRFARVRVPQSPTRIAQLFLRRLPCHLILRELRQGRPDYPSITSAYTDSVRALTNWLRVP
jgi:hypothetical protein